MIQSGSEPYLTIRRNWEIFIQSRIEKENCFLQKSFTFQSIF